MSDFVTSLIRTYVPIVVGWAVATLLQQGIEIDSSQAEVLFTGVVIGLYYAIARKLESKWSVFGILLGKKSTPTYSSN